MRISQTDVEGFGFISASFGIATFPDHASSRDTLVVAADRALYSAKHGGRNRVCLPPVDATDDGSDCVPAESLYDLSESATAPGAQP